MLDASNHLSRYWLDVIFDPQINGVNVENSTVDRAVDLIQSKKKKLLLLVEKKALQQVVVCSCFNCSFYGRSWTIHLLGGGGGGGRGWLRYLGGRGHRSLVHETFLAHRRLSPSQNVRSTHQCITTKLAQSQSRWRKKMFGRKKLKFGVKSR